MWKKDIIGTLYEHKYLQMRFSPAEYVDRWSSHTGCLWMDHSRKLYFALP